jgi:hypothetical protein
MKANYKAGKYRLDKEILSLDGLPTITTIYLDNLTSAQAKALFKNSLYERLGYKSIEWIEDLSY